MKKILLVLFSAFLMLSPVTPARAFSLNDLAGKSPMNLSQYEIQKLPDTCDLSAIEGADTDVPAGRFAISNIAAPNILLFGLQSADGTPCVKSALLPQTSKYVAMLFQNQISSQEYIADLRENMGLPKLAQPAYAQGTGYGAMAPFLPFWKAFRNLAYSLYIIMFVVVGVMIMLRTKVNAQTIITIQTALPNLLITLLLITFSYAIVGFMVDIMYFLIYFMVYLLNTVGIIDSPVKAISRLMSKSAWSVIFDGRNSVIWAVAAASDSLLSGLGTGVVGFLGKAAAIVSPSALIAGVWLGVTMIKLMLTLVKAYVMLIIQTVTAPVQILMNAMPGSKAFSEWLKKTASYLLPFPVVGAMFIFAAILVGDPTDSLLFKGTTLGDPNPFGVNTGSEFYSAVGADGKMWLPPFTLTGSNLQGNDIMALIGFFIFTMTPAAAKMAMDWLQVKESPYTSEIGAGLSGAWAVGGWPIRSGIGAYEREAGYRRQAKLFNPEQYRQPGVTPVASQPIGSKEPQVK